MRFIGKVGVVGQIRLRENISRSTSLIVTPTAAAAVKWRAKKSQHDKEGTNDEITTTTTTTKTRKKDQTERKEQKKKKIVTNTRSRYKSASTTTVAFGRCYSLETGQNVIPEAPRCACIAHCCRTRTSLPRTRWRESRDDIESESQTTFSVWIEFGLFSQYYVWIRVRYIFNSFYTLHLKNTVSFQLLYDRRRYFNETKRSQKFADLSFKSRTKTYKSFIIQQLNYLFI